jgi:hypothetical protein
VYSSLRRSRVRLGTPRLFLIPSCGGPAPTATVSDAMVPPFWPPLVRRPGEAAGCSPSRLRPGGTGPRAITAACAQCNTECQLSSFWPGLSSRRSRQRLSQTCRPVFSSSARSCGRKIFRMHQILNTPTDPIERERVMAEYCIAQTEYLEAAVALHRAQLRIAAKT